MDPRFIATPTPHSIAAALQLWPELDGKSIRPLLVSAFGEVFVEEHAGAVWSADPIELKCERVARSLEDFQALFSDPKWAQERLLVEVVLLAEQRGKQRPQHQVFAIAPHPRLGGQIRPETLMPMDLEVWHHICAQVRGHV